MAGIKALFTGKQILNVLEQFQKDVDAKTLQSLQFIGEEFVNRARLNGNYRDRTGNLRSSIGYIILNNGKVVDQNFEGKKQEGKAKAKSVAGEVSGLYPNGFVLIGVAGMEYAAAVEAKGFDVITGAAPNKNDLGSLLNDIFSEI